VYVINLCFSRPNEFTNAIESVDTFSIDSRSQIQNNITTCSIKLQDFSLGKMLKINLRNNDLHYRVCQKHQLIRFELEFKN
jgi:hypothetical protein